MARIVVYLFLTRLEKLWYVTFILLLHHRQTFLKPREKCSIGEDGLELEG